MTIAVHKLFFPEAGVRGVALSLQDIWQQVREIHHDKTEDITLLGELLVANALLNSDDKVAQELTLQLHGLDPWGLVVSKTVLAADTLSLCGTVDSAMVSAAADYQANTTKQTLRVDDNTAPMLVSTLQRNGHSYQAIIALTAQPNVTAAIEAYIRDSLQLPARLWIYVSAQGAAGLMLQKMPIQGGIKTVEVFGTDENNSHEEGEAWRRLSLLADTLTPAEALQQPVEDWLQKLFWQEECRVSSPLTLRFACSCSREKVAQTLRLLGQEESEKILATDKKIQVGCSFCGQQYVFTDYPLAIS